MVNCNPDALAPGVQRTTGNSQVVIRKPDAPAPGVQRTTGNVNVVICNPGAGYLQTRV